MKKYLIVLSTVLFLTACGQESKKESKQFEKDSTVAQSGNNKDKAKEASTEESSTEESSDKSTDKSVEESTETQDEATADKNSATDKSIDINALKAADPLSETFKQEFMNNHEVGYKGLYKGKTFKEIKDVLGNYEEIDMYYRGYGIVFSELPNVEMIFGDGEAGTPSDDAKLKTVYFKNVGSYVSPEDFTSVWGEPKYIGTIVGGLSLYYYENQDGTYTEAEIGRGLFSQIRKLDKASYIEALRSSYSMTDENLTLNVLHKNVAEGFVSNFFNVDHLKVGESSQGKTKEQIGKYSLDSEAGIVTKVAMDIRSDKVNLNELKAVWGNKYTDTNVDGKIITVYDVQPDDGYVTKVTSSSDGMVEEVGVYSDGNHN